MALHSAKLPMQHDEREYNAVYLEVYLISQLSTTAGS